MFGSIQQRYLTGVGPDVGDQTVGLGQSVQSIVGFGLSSQFTGQGVGLDGTWDQLTRFIDFGDSDLDRGVVLGLDDSAGGRTLSWNVQFNLKNVLVFGFLVGFWLRASGKHFLRGCTAHSSLLAGTYNFTLIVLHLVMD